jgi:hypothetical protein
MSLKLHFLLSHLDLFFSSPPENMGAISYEHGKRFHLDISQTEKRNSEQWSPNLETLTAENKRQEKMK